MNFNSIKVRLEPIVLLIIADYRLFQFHKGTIRTMEYIFAGTGYMHFNSIKVRLEHG